MALLITVIVLPWLALAGGLELASNAVVRLDDAILLILAISLFRETILRRGFFSPWVQFFSGRPHKRIEGRLTTLACFLALPLSVGVVPLLIDALKDAVVSPLRLAAVVMRALCATMFILPTTIGAAAVVSQFPAMDSFVLFVLGTGLFIVSALLAGAVAIRTIEPPQECTATIQSTMPVLLSLASVYLIGHWAMGLNTVQSTVLSMFIVSGWVLFNETAEARWTVLSVAFRRTTPELWLLMACGVLMGLIETLQAVYPISPTLLATAEDVPTWVAYAMVIFVLPLGCVIGAHPMIVFSLGFPLLLPWLGLKEDAYVVWITFFISAQLLSPVSISAVLAAGCLNIPPYRVSFGLQLPYVMTLGGLVLFVLLVGYPLLLGMGAQQ
ncbi:hypothetical protein EXN22_22540 [Pseudomonas tructae]|uniref:TRAP transporter large permease subunit n=1 Tax=Pseudomonas tructae TaxID=2518644 RepID=A0A411MNE1_9PSED|nr:hypothetical protein [Pseudomonas tructae]QBF28335.1 hypothetical protein EXN22_22540 [Pseudomonas tructae]